jgi:hypothetical protein
MEFGKLQGEVAAAGHVAVSLEVPAASIVGVPFNVAGVTLTGTGLVTVILGDGVDQKNCAVVATGTTAGDSVTANNAGADTDLQKHFIVADATGDPINGGFYFAVVRTQVS